MLFIVGVGGRFWGLAAPPIEDSSGSEVYLFLSFIFSPTRQRTERDEAN